MTPKFCFDKSFNFPSKIPNTESYLMINFDSERFDQLLHRILESIDYNKMFLYQKSIKFSLENLTLGLIFRFSNLVSADKISCLFLDNTHLQILYKSIWVKFQSYIRQYAQKLD